MSMSTISSRAAMAEKFLGLIPNQDVHMHDGMYVRLAYDYGVPFGRIVSLSGLAADVVAAHLEEAD